MIHGIAADFDLLHFVWLFFYYCGCCSLSAAAPDQASLSLYIYKYIAWLSADLCWSLVYPIRSESTR